MNDKYILVYDLETSSTDPHTTDMLQLSCVAVHPKKLEIIEGSIFDSLVRPAGLNDRKKYYNDNKSTLDWHANNQNCTVDEFLDTLESAPDEKFVLNAFAEYAKDYHEDNKKKSVYSAPIRAGYNIFNFDNIILDRLCQKYKLANSSGTAKMFDRRIQLDIMQLVWLWLKDTDVTENLKMDTLREVFGLASEGAHEGKKDVIDEATIMIRFLNLNKHFGTKVVWHATE